MNTNYNNDIEYLEYIVQYVREISYHLRNVKKLSESSLEEMISTTIDLLRILELYKNDKYYDY